MELDEFYNFIIMVFSIHPFSKKNSNMAWFCWLKFRQSHVTKYSPVHKCRPKTLWAGNQGNHQNFDPSLLPKNLWLVFMGKAKKFQNGRLKKPMFFKTVNSQYFFVKLSGIGPWVRRINWCKGHQCDSTNMVVRQSDIRPKTGKKHKKIFFCLF